MVTAAAQDQWRLLDVQDHDTRLNQIAHRRQTLPEHAQLASLEDRLARISDQLVLARTASTDVSRELTKAEADVEQVRRDVDVGPGCPDGVEEAVTGTTADGHPRHLRRGLARHPNPLRGAGQRLRDQHRELAQRPRGPE